MHPALDRHKTRSMDAVCYVRMDVACAVCGVVLAGCAAVSALGLAYDSLTHGKLSRGAAPGAKAA